MYLQTTFIGDLVASDFRSAAIFKKHGIDFCCKGGRTIEQACAPKKINPELIYNDIQNLPKGGGDNIDFTSWPLDLLADYVERIHHRYCEEKTPILQAFLDKLCKVHGPAHPELFEVRDLFNASAQDLGAHLKKEELVLFPFIKQMVKAKQTGEALRVPHFGSVENPVAMMKHEHTIEGERFRKMAEITDEFTPPAGACNTYRVAYAMLAEFEDDLHRHIHIENNILFPKAISLEKEFSTEEE